MTNGDADLKTEQQKTLSSPRRRYGFLAWMLFVLMDLVEFVRDNSSFENESFDSDFKEDYGDFKNLTDLFRRIRLDERVHKEESLARIEKARFA